MDWLDLLAVQGTLESLLQHHISKTSILWRSAFFIVQLSHPYVTTGKTIALTRWTLLRGKTELYGNKKSVYDIITQWLMNYISFLTLTNVYRLAREDSDLKIVIEFDHLWYFTNICPYTNHTFRVKLFKNYYLFIFCCTGSLLLCTGLLQLLRAGVILHCSAWASTAVASLVAEHRL